MFQVMKALHVMKRRVRAAQGADARHRWIGTETVDTRLGSFPFVNGYPAGNTAARLREALSFNRAVEAYLVQMPAVSFYNVWRGCAEAGPGAPNQLVIWETLMDSATLLLTGNTETVYGLAALDLKRDGPVVMEVPAGALGGIVDLWQRQVVDIGSTGVDRGAGGKFLLLPPDHDGPIPEGYFVVRCSTYCCLFGGRMLLEHGRPEPGVELLKTMRIYPLSQAGSPQPVAVVNGSQREIDTIFPDDGRFFDQLAWMIEREPEDTIPTHERFQLAALGIRKGMPFEPDEERRKLFDEAARLASAIARVNSFASDDHDALVYADRRWQWAFIGGKATWDAQGYVNTDRRAAFAYIALGMSPAMVDKHVGAGSQYLWTPRDAAGAFLDGGKRYRLHVPAGVPVEYFWSIVAYDAQSRSLLRNGQAFPTVSTYTGPEVNPDGSIDVWFGPDAVPGKEKNWIQTVPRKGWFVLFRFYGPLQPFFEQTWKPGDIEPLD